MANWLTQESSLLLAVQDDYVTPYATVGDYKSIRCEKPSITTTGTVSRLDTLDGIPGSAQAVVVGSKHGGELSFKMPLTGFKDGYDPTTEDPGDTGVIPEWLCLAANAMGSGVRSLSSSGATLQADFWKGAHLSNSAYAAANIAAASTTDLLKTSSAAGYEVGQLVAFDPSGSGAPAELSGWIKEKAVNDLTLFEALGFAGSTGGNMYGTATGYISSAQPRVLSAIYTGDDTTDAGAGASAAYRLTGLICRGFSLSLEAGDTPMIEFRYYYTNREQITATGLSIPSARPRIAPILGSRGGALRVDGAVRCGIGSFSVELECAIAETRCHSAPQGVSEALVTAKTVKVSCQVPWDSADAVTGGVHLWEKRLEDETATSMSVTTGEDKGRMLGMLVPAAQQVDFPGMTDADGRLSYDLTMEAGAYSADGGTPAAPGDTVFRLGVG